MLHLIISISSNDLVRGGWFLLWCSWIYFCWQICWAIVIYNAIFKQFLSTHPIDQHSAASPGGILLVLGCDFEEKAAQFRIDALFGKKPWSKSSVLIQLVAGPSYEFPAIECHVWHVARCSLLEQGQRSGERGTDLALGMCATCYLSLIRDYRLTTLLLSFSSATFPSLPKPWWHPVSITLVFVILCATVGCGTGKM